MTAWDGLDGLEKFYSVEPVNPIVSDVNMPQSRQKMIRNIKMLLE